MAGMRARMRRLDLWDAMSHPAIRDHRVLFFHAPKCGGTSVDKVLQRSFGPWRTLTGRGIHAIDAHATRIAAEAQKIPSVSHREKVLLAAARDRSAVYIGGHLPFSRGLEAPEVSGWNWVTLLREPEDRFLSAYHYNANKATQDHYGTDLDLEAYLDSPRAQLTGATYVTFFCGVPAEVAAVPSLSREAHMVEAAIDTLRRFRVVGQLAQMGRFTADMNSAFGVQLDFGHLNRNPAGRYARREDLPMGIRKKLDEICAPDRHVYDIVVGSSVV